MVSTKLTAVPFSVCSLPVTKLFWRFSMVSSVTASVSDVRLRSTQQEVLVVSKLPHREFCFVAFKLAQIC